MSDVGFNYVISSRVCIYCAPYLTQLAVRKECAPYGTGGA